MRYAPGMEGGGVKYLDQLRLAIERHDETGGNWATEGAIVVACGAIWGDLEMCRALDEDTAWKPETFHSRPERDERG